MLVFGWIPIFDSLVIIEKHISTRGCAICENMIFCDHSWTKKRYPTNTNKYSLYIINIILLNYVMYIVNFKMWSKNRKRNTQCVLRSIEICHWFILLVLIIVTKTYYRRLDKQDEAHILWPGFAVYFCYILPQGHHVSHISFTYNVYEEKWLLG